MRKTVFQLMISLGLVMAGSAGTKAQTPWYEGASNTPASSGNNKLGTASGATLKDLIFVTGGTDRLTVKSDGNLVWTGSTLFLGADRFLESRGTTSTFLGLGAGNTSMGLHNTYLGYQAGVMTTTGGTNTFVGTQAGALNKTGDGNTFMGYHAGYFHNGTDDNVYIGANAGYNSDSLATANTFIGVDAGFSISTGAYNAFLGSTAGKYTTTGSNNTYSGFGAGTTNTTGSYNVFTGYGADAASNNLQNATAIGTSTIVSASNTMRFGNSSVTKWGFGVNAGSGKAIEVGTLGNPGNGAYLSDGGAWTNPSDANLKQDITEVNYKDVLSAIRSMPVSRWSYKIEPGITHIGPMAQDFYAAFKTGSDDRHISTIDPAGVALAGIKQLADNDDQQQSQIDALKAENNELKIQLIAIQEQLNRLVPPSNTDVKSTNDKVVPVLFQNEPNPFNENTVIRYYVPSTSVDAKINIYSSKGELVSTNRVNEKGSGQISLTANRLSPGMYTYELVIDGRQVDIKKMIIK